MGKYLIQLSKRAEKDLQAIKKSGQKLIMKKVKTLFLELELHPKFGLGSPEQLKHFDGEVWSREINKKIGLFMKFSKKICLLLLFNL